MERAYFVENEEYALNGAIASATTPLAFVRLAIEIMPTARYTYTIEVPDPTHFTCTAEADLDDDPTHDIWTIDETGTLVNRVDDSYE